MCLISRLILGLIKQSPLARKKMEAKDNFEAELKELKKETAAKFNKLTNKYANVKDWKVEFEYSWVLRVNSFVDETDVYGVEDSK